MSISVNATIEKLVEQMRPEAREFVGAVMSDPLPITENNYGRVMTMLSRLQEKNGRAFAQVFLVAMVREGYSKETAYQLSHIMGWS